MKISVFTVIMALALVGCGRGPQGDRGPTGFGYVGPQGPAGQNGQDGTGCSVSTINPGGSLPNGGALITCGATQTIISNGSDGLPGAAAPASEVLNPCGVQGTHDEVLIRSGSLVIASFSDSAAGANTRFSVLQPNTQYVTTDGTNCHFSIAADGSLN